MKQMEPKSHKKMFYLPAVVVISFIFCGYFYNFSVSTQFIPKDILQRVSTQFFPKDTLKRNELTKWIALWLPSHLKADVSYLTNIPGWNVVVVGDGVRPQGCRNPNCVFLDPVGQTAMGSSLAALLPPNDPAKKNLAYLYAIKQGAQFIYDTDINIAPLNNLSDFFYGNTSGLVYIGGGIFNYYKHYGEHWFNPRGFDKSNKDSLDPSAYVLKDIPQPEVQSGLVKVKGSSGPRFQSVVPTVFVGAQAFAPFDANNTMFHRRSFWGLFTLPEPNGDILRSYFIQTLLKYIQGYVGILPPNAQQDDNSQVRESNVTTIPQSLLSLLYEWKCANQTNLETCFTELVSRLLSERFIKEESFHMTKEWLSDLNDFGYRISDNDLKEPLKLTPKTNKLQRGVSSKTVEFSPSPQVYYKNNPDSNTYKSVRKICHTFTYPERIPYQFDDVLLVISFNYPGMYRNILYLEAIHRRYFPHILYCGPNSSDFRSSVKILPANTTVTYVDGVERGWQYFHECTVYAMKMNFNVKGYLQIGDDSLVNPWNLINLSRDQFWFNKKYRNASRLTDKDKWIRWRVSSGRRAFDKAFTHIENIAKRPEDSMEKRFYKQYMENVKSFNIAFYETSDFFYVPNCRKEEFVYFTRLFCKTTLIVESFIPTIILGFDAKENITRITAKAIWGGQRNHPEKYFNTSDHYLHALKGSQLKDPNCQKFVCHIFLPTLVKKMKMSDINK